MRNSCVPSLFIYDLFTLGHQPRIHGCVEPGAFNYAYNKKKPYNSLKTLPPSNAIIKFSSAAGV